MEPLIQLLQGRSYGKALQLYVDDKPFLVIGSSRLTHAELLEQLLIKEGIPFKREPLFGPDVGPSRIGETYQLVGAGWASVSGDKIGLDGQSDGYQIKIDTKHIVAMNGLNLGWKIEAKPPIYISSTSQSDGDWKELDEDIPF